MISVLLIGFVGGLRHATDADHVAAVSAIVSEKKNLWTAAVVGGFWGVGHTISLFAAGLLAVLLKFQISESVEAKLEAAVGVMLVLLGLNALRKVFAAKEIHAHPHEHNGRTHTHFHVHTNETKTAEDVQGAEKTENAEKEESHHFSPRSLVIGMIHGLAGSAGLTLLVVPTISSPAVALLFILIFGIGSIAGMMLMSFLLGLPFHYTAGRFEFFNKAVRLCAALFSFGIGMLLIYEKLWQA